MKKLLNKIDYKMFIFPVFMFFIVLIVLLTYPTKFEIIYKGGTNKSTSDIVYNKNKNLNDNLYSVYVKVLTYAPPLLRIIAEDNKDLQVLKLTGEYSKLSRDEEFRLSRFYAVNSHEFAKYAALKHAKEKVSDINYEVITKSMYVLNISSSISSYVHINDRIIEVNNKKVTTQNVSDLKKELLTSINLKLKLIRDEKELVVDIKKTDDMQNRVLLAVQNEIETKSNREFSILEDGKKGGSSAGLLKTVSLYFELINKKINPNIKIAITGTINQDLSVGAIGGIQQKIYSVNDTMDYFIVPVENEDEAMIAINRLKSKNKLKVKVLFAKDLSDAIKYIGEI